MTPTAPADRAPSLPPDPREAAALLRLRGLTLAQIGAALGVTKQRVHQMMRSPLRVRRAPPAVPPAPDPALAAWLRRRPPVADPGRYSRWWADRPWRHGR